MEKSWIIKFKDGRSDIETKFISISPSGDVVYILDKHFESDDLECIIPNNGDYIWAEYGGKYHMHKPTP